MNKDLILHPETEKLIAQLTLNLPQSLLLTGPVGVGLKTIALELAGDNLASIISPEGSGEVIKIESIRELYEQTRSKNTSRQIVIIDDAERMSRSAQTAFLKLLEEPSSSTHFILTSHKPQHLLATISSRLQSFHIRPSTFEQTNKIIEQRDIKPATKRTQLQFMASGLPAELTRLINDEMYFREQASIMGDARKLLQESPYQKLIIVHSYQKDRMKSLRLIEAAQKILKLSLSQTPRTELVEQLDRLERIYLQISNNASSRLQLTRFVL